LLLSFLLLSSGVVLWCRFPTSINVPGGVAG